MTPEQIQVACYLAAVALVAWLLARLGRESKTCEVCRVLGRPCSQCGGGK